MDWLEAKEDRAWEMTREQEEQEKKARLPQEKHFVTFESPGTLFSESSVFPIGAWDPKLAMGMLREKDVTERYNAKPYGFYFETRLVADPIPDGRGGELEVESKRVKRSGLHYILGEKGVVETYDQVVDRDLDDERILRSNMAGNDYWLIVTTFNSFKSTRPFEVDDVAVDAKGKIVERGNDPLFVSYRQMCHTAKETRLAAERLSDEIVNRKKRSKERHHVFNG